MRRFAPVRPVTLVTLVTTGALVLTGCGSEDAPADSTAELSVSGAYMPQPVSDSMAAGFLTVTNKGSTKDELTSVTSDVGEVTAHETVGSSMREAKDLAVPAHGQLVFKSGGSHLMFEKLKRKPQQGEKVTVQLHFAESGTVTVEMPVESATYNPKTGH
ncbi:copper chaperone PCu(A)C [Streptomyces bicolor]|uniref:copper chaperone PCu(A)C n=1 Tax=Streptomyces bicolor TaxID=66874 RepID=UPI000691EA69|nr:copper chaperone PCu(A)C [Streptomyces bicolor]